jgi:hypothetical protein
MRLWPRVANGHGARAGRRAEEEPDRRNAPRDGWSAYAPARTFAPPRSSSIWLEKPLGCLASDVPRVCRFGLALAHRLIHALLTHFPSAHCLM